MPTYLALSIRSRDSSAVVVCRVSCVVESVVCRVTRLDSRLHSQRLRSGACAHMAYRIRYNMHYEALSRSPRPDAELALVRIARISMIETSAGPNESPLALGPSSPPAAPLCVACKSRAGRSLLNVGRRARLRACPALTRENVQVEEHEVERGRRIFFSRSHRSQPTVHAALCANELPCNKPALHR